MRLDELAVDQLPNTWRWAQNISVFQKGSAITNEDGADNITDGNYPQNKKCIGSISMNEEQILFFGTTNPSDSEIGIVKKDLSYTTIIKDSSSRLVLNFNQNFPIQGAFEKKNNNTIIAWTDFNNPVRILNIDCPPFIIDTDKTVITADLDRARALINLFSDYTTPTIPEYNIEVKEGIGNLTTGAYYPFLQYKLLDGSYTSFGKIYNGIPIFPTNVNSDSITITGGQPGDSTNKGIEITFSNIDTNYKAIRVGYLYSKNQVITAYYEKEVKITFSSTKVILTGRNQTSVSLSEVLVPNSVYSKAKTITTLQKKLYLGNVEQDIDFDYQTYANQITLQWEREREVAINGIAKVGLIGGTYQNPGNTFFNKSFKSGEAYAFYIVFRLKNGLYTKAFHIPGRIAVTGDRDILNPSTDAQYYNYNQLDSGNPVYKYQVLNTHTNITDTKGNLGFWENEDEEYPLDPNNSANVHPDFANIPGVTVSDRKVRHHVFPDLTYLDGNGSSEKFITGTFTASSGTYPVNDIKTKAFGVIVSNVNIPNQFFNLVDSWEIHYAERDNSSIRIIGNDCPTEWGGGDNRFHLFDSMAFKPNLAPNYVKPLCDYGNLGETSGQEANFVEDLSAAPIVTNLQQFKIRACTNFAYIGENTTVPVNNSNRADAIFLQVSSAAGFLTQNFDIDTTGSTQFIELHDLCIYRRNIYLNFETQILIATNDSFIIPVPGIQATRAIYAGDIYINRHSLNPKNSGTKAISYICESASNIGLRNEDFTQSKFFAPKYPNPSPSWYGYNRDFNCINTFNQIPVYYPSETCETGEVSIFSDRIPYSDVSADESSTSTGWRTFRANSYYELVKDKGAIWNILGSNRTLYINTEYTLFLSEIKDKFGTNDSEIFLGSSDIFDRPPYEVVTTSEGFGGTQSQFACILCKLGYCFIDRNKGKVFLLPFGGQLIEISDNSMFNFFLDNSQTTQDIDNPFIGNGYTMGYNDRNNTIVICKQDTAGYNFTISYCPDLNEGKGGWVSFHTYSPNILLFNRRGFFAIDNTRFKIFKHNSDTTKTKFYDNTIVSSYIDAVFNESSEVTKRYDNANWITVVESAGVTYKKLTLTGLVVYNETQCSELIDLTMDSTLWFGKSVKNTEDTWNFNTFRDLVKDTDLPFIDNKGALINSNIDLNKTWFEKSKFISKFIIFRLVNNNTNQYNVHISQVGTNANKSDR